MALKKGVYGEKNISVAQKLQLKGELRVRADQLLRESDKIQRQASSDMLSLRRRR